VPSSPFPFPSYYDEIKNPMSLETADKKISNGRYRTWGEFAYDMKLMFDKFVHSLFSLSFPLFLLVLTTPPFFSPPAADTSTVPES